MAEKADEVSLSHIAAFLGERTGTIVDVGAGDSVSLGRALRARGHEYRPVDMRQDAVERHRAAGFAAVRSIAGALDVPTSTADVVHSRFTLAWLSPGEREQALTEMIRVSKPEGRLVLIDYDWSVIEGLPIFRDTVGRLHAIMRGAGFDPDYGGTSMVDIEARLAAALGAVAVSDGDATALTVRSSIRVGTYRGPVSGAMEIVERTMKAVIEQLSRIGASEDVAVVARDLAEFQRYVANDSTFPVRLPDIVAVEVLINDRSALPVLAERYRHQVAYREDVDYAVPFETLPNTVVALSDELILEGRRVQAAAYEKERVVDASAIDPVLGTLVLDNDPLDLVHRSRYFMTLRHGRVAGEVRLIEPDERGFASLPTVQRLTEHGGGGDTQRWLAEHGITEPRTRLAEVSALARSMEFGAFPDVVDAVLASAEYAYRAGVDFCVMGLQEGRVPLIRRTFGADALAPIDAEDARHPVSLPGVISANRFVPFVGEPGAFVMEVRRHATEQAGGTNALTAAFYAHIAEVCDSLIASRSLDARSAEPAA